MFSKGSPTLDNGKSSWSISSHSCWTYRTLFLMKIPLAEKLCCWQSGVQLLDGLNNNKNKLCLVFILTLKINEHFEVHLIK